MTEIKDTAKAAAAEPSFKALALQYARRGWHVFPVTPTASTPPLVRWGRDCTTDEDTIRRWWKKWPTANVGIACGPSGLCVVDLDVKGGKNGVEELERLQLLYEPLPETLTARTPSGGVHLYFRGSTATTVNLRNKHPGIDTRSGGGQGGYVLAPGSVTAAGRYDWTEERPVADLPRWLADLVGSPAATGAPGRGAPAVELDLPHNIARAEELLRTAAPAIEGQGGDDRTLTVANLVGDLGISDMTCLDLMLAHYNPRCQPPWDAEELAVKVRNAYRYRTSPVGCGTAEADFDDDPPEVPEVPERPRHPVLDRWVWVAEASVFVHRTGPMRYTADQWKSMFAGIVPKGSVLDLIWKGKLPMRKFHSMVYLPGRPEFVAAECYNLWRPSGVPERPGDASWFTEHLEYLVPDAVERGHVLDWLSLVVRGQKLNFALLLASTAQGIGKSAVADLMGRILGGNNVSNPSNKEIAERFTAWCEGVQLAVIAELKADRRSDIVNHLKPIITDRDLRIEVKGRTPYKVPNHLNILASTNHLDALPIDAADRRWLVVRSPAVPRDGAYYNALFGHIESDASAGAVKHLLLNRKVALDPKGQAPLTAGKREMGELTAPEVASWLRERLDERSSPFEFDLVRLDDVAEAVQRRFRSAKARQEALLFLQAAEAKKHTPYKKDGKYPNAVLWSVRNQERWEAEGPAGRAKAFAANGPLLATL